jgi:ketosteroid isomerase-like protein
MKTKSLFIIGLIALLFLHLQLWAQDLVKVPSVEEQLTQIEHEWGNSYVKRDPSFAQRITANDFSFVSPDGTMVGKDEYVKSIGAGPTVFTAFNIETIKVRSYGDAAVVTGVAMITAKTGDKDESGRYSFTDTFVKQNGEWKVVSGQATAITKQ